ncbi:MAG TPA: TonB family protein [Allosphingosinicella sp.]|jgi:TonB family protein
MISRRVSLTLCAAAIALPYEAAEPQGPIQGPPIIFAPPAPPAPPSPRPNAPPSPRPLSSGLRVIGGPDWGDPAIYPAAALRDEHEGPVTFELLVERSGRPSTCTIVSSSGSGHLDSGTCALAMTMRFAPPPEPTRTRIRVVWLLAGEPMPFEPQRLLATIEFADGAVASCALDGAGPLFDEWARVACRTFEIEADYYFGARRWTARRATVAVDMVPEGSPAPEAPPGEQIAVRRTSFSVDSNGDPGNCRTLADRGFGRPRIDHADACGFFMAQGFEFVADEDQEAEPRRGTVTVQVLIDPKGPERRRR